MIRRLNVLGQPAGESLGANGAHMKKRILVVED